MSQDEQRILAQGIIEGLASLDNTHVATPVPAVFFEKRPSDPKQAAEFDVKVSESESAYCSALLGRSNLSKTEIQWLQRQVAAELKRMGR